MAIGTMEMQKIPEHHQRRGIDLQLFCRPVHRLSSWRLPWACDSTCGVGLQSQQTELLSFLFLS
jgi:hypothetical protein